MVGMPGGASTADNLAAVTIDDAMARNGVVGSPPPGVVIRVAPAWLRRLWVGPVQAMTLPGVIYASPDAFRALEQGTARALLIHELEHVHQWRDHGRLGFTIRYLGDYVGARLAGFSHATAYRAISFEREARAAARDAT